MAVVNNESGNLQLIHANSHGPVVADKTGGRPSPKPKSGRAGGKDTVWTKAPSVEACRAIPGTKWATVRAKLAAAVDRRNAAKDGLQRQHAEEAIDQAIFHDVSSVRPGSKHLAGVADPVRAKMVDNCVVSSFAGDSAGEAYLADEIRGAQYVRVLTGMVALNDDIKGRPDKIDDHEAFKRDLVADASDYIVAARPNEKDLSAEEVTKHRFYRLGELANKLVGNIDEKLYADMIIQCAKDMHIEASAADLETLHDMKSAHHRGPIDGWVSARMKELH